MAPSAELKAGDAAEQVGVTEPDAKRLPPSQRQSCNRPVLAVRMHAIVRLHEGDEIFNQIPAEPVSLTLHRVVAFRKRRRRRVGISVRHHDNERLQLSIGDEVIQNQVRPAGLRPAALVAAGAVKQVQDRVPIGRSTIVRRRVDEHAPHGLDRL
jgi:hypothetical protein